LKKYPKAFKIYYGAGQRYIPQDDIKYDLNLVDSGRQREKLIKLGYNAHRFIKPAAKLFHPWDVEKKYDVLFVGNGSHSRLKGHELMLRSFAGTNISILNIGNTDERLISLAKKLNVNIKWAGWHLRKDLPSFMSQCKLALVCTTDIDSCPRVIPEALACNLPVVITDNVHFWKRMYIKKDETGVICKRTEKDILKKVKYVLNNLDMYDCKQHSEGWLCMESAAEYLKDSYNICTTGQIDVPEFDYENATTIIYQNKKEK